MEFGSGPWGSLPARFKADPGPREVPRRSRGRSGGGPPREARRPVTMVILGSVEETVGETVGGQTARFKGYSAQKTSFGNICVYLSNAAAPVVWRR